MKIAFRARTPAMDNTTTRSRRLRMLPQTAPNVGPEAEMLDGWFAIAGRGLLLLFRKSVVSNKKCPT